MNGRNPRTLEHSLTMVDEAESDVDSRSLLAGMIVPMDSAKWLTQNLGRAGINVINRRLS